MLIPNPKQIRHRRISTILRLSFGNLCNKDSATASNIFCRELIPANIIAIYKMIANTCPKGMSCKIVGNVTNNNPGPDATSRSYEKHAGMITKAATMAAIVSNIAVLRETEITSSSSPR